MIIDGIHFLDFYVEITAFENNVFHILTVPI